MANPWTELDMSAWWAFLRSNTLVIRELSNASQEQDMPLEWFDVLVNLYQWPDDQMPLGDLVNNVALSRSGLTRLLDRMEKASLIERRLSKTDRRKFDVHLTDEGAKEFERTNPGIQNAVSSLFLNHLTDADKKAVHKALAKVIQAIEV
jgi:DNA-binding MarR family transcriptional regulator